MRMALVTDGVFPHVVGGMQKYVYNLTRALAAMGVEVDLLQTVRPDGGPEALEALRGSVPGGSGLVRSIPVPYSSLPPIPGHYVAETAIYSRRLSRALDARPEPDVVYAHGLTAVALRGRGRGGSTPLAVNLHGLEMFQRTFSLRQRLAAAALRPLARLCLRGADVVLGFGGEIEAIAQREAPGVPYVRVANGVERGWLHDGSTGPGSPPRLVFVGRNERRKGLPELNQALSRVIEDVPDLRVDFVGPLPEEERLSSPGVQYHGLMRDEEAIRSILRAADVLVCPSHAEGMPTVILEAMACGLAVVATEVGAVSDLVDEENGWMVPPGDVDALAAALRRALEATPEALRRRKEASLRRIRERFLWSRVAEDTVEALRPWI